MSVWRLHHAPTREFLEYFIAHLERWHTAFTLEFTIPHIGEQKIFSLILPFVPPTTLAKNLRACGWQPSNDHSIFYPQGIHVSYILRPKKIMENTEMIAFDLPPLASAGEGVSIQYCFQPMKQGIYGANIRVIASAPRYYRASEILDLVSQPFRKNFRIVKPDHNAALLTAYAYHQFDHTQKISLTFDQIISVLPAIN